MAGEPNSMASIEYLVHDFGHLCRQMKATSQILLFDLGASLSFGAKKLPSPVLKLVKMFRKFGLPFNHIYAWELNVKDPNTLFKEELPEYMDAAYHFINVGVSDDPESRQNPFKLLLENYNEDDVIIVKLDIDNPDIERKLVDQLLNNPRLLKLIDHFYFEHHVNQKVCMHCNIMLQADRSGRSAILTVASLRFIRNFVLIGVSCLRLLRNR